MRPSFGEMPERWFDADHWCGPCKEKAEQKSKEEYQIRWDQERIEAAFRAAMITPRFRERTFETFAVNEENKKTYEIAKSFRVIGDGSGIMFYGSFGVGKTHLAAAIANSMIGKMSVLYISAPDLLTEIRSNMNRQGNSDRMDLAKQAKLLILDDIGAEKPSEWVRETLFVLINHRYEHKLSTIFTTNCTLAELEERLGGRISSRIAEMCRCVKMNGDDWRLQPKPDWKQSAGGEV